MRLLSSWDVARARDRQTLRRTNVDGSARVFAAVGEAGVPALGYASSIGVYSPGPKRRVDESWPREGVPTSWYAHGAEETVRELLAAIAAGASSETPPLRKGDRVEEIKAGVGAKPL